ncbi:hypothetical protein CHUAL_007110 [Chamberlinius hualienensis]
MAESRLRNFYFNFSIIRAIWPLILLLRAFGIDAYPPITESRKRKLILSIVFGFHMIVSTFFCYIYASIARFDREDTTLLIASLYGFLFVTDGFLSKLYLRYCVKELRQLVKLLQKMFSSTGQNDRKFLFIFGIFTLIFSIFPTSCLLTIFGKTDGKLDYYKRRYPITVQLNQFISAPLSNIWILTIISMLVILLIPLIYYLKILSNIHFSAPNNLLTSKVSLKEMVNFVRLHRYVRQYLSLYDQILRQVLLQVFLLEMIMCLVFGRSAVAEGMMEQNIYAALKYFLLLSAEMIVIGLVNQLLMSCLNEVVYVKLRLDARCKALEMATAMSAKLDLYITHVQLNKPTITVGGLVSVEKSSVISMAGFYLTYLCFLYDH